VPAPIMDCAALTSDADCVRSALVLNIN
jgi:hypothetical protein